MNNLKEKWPPNSQPCLINNFNDTHIILSKDCDYNEQISHQDLLQLSAQDINNDDLCMDIKRTPEDYRSAFLTNITLIILPLVIFFNMCAREMLPTVKKIDIFLRDLLNTNVNGIGSCLITAFIYPLWLITAFICAPFFIVFVAARQVYYKFRHRRAKRKNLFRKQLQKSEYLWGISRTAEAGLESCGQLILQVWLLSSDFKSLSR